MDKGYLKKRSFLIPLALMLISLCACGEAYASKRDIRVEDLNGTAIVASSDAGETGAFVGQTLISGDAVSVADSSDMIIQMDGDKHLFADAGTRFSIEADGKEGSTKTKIHVEEGSTLIGIDNKLKNAESFEILTPNVMMAVRGTTFWVRVQIENGIPTTTLEVLEGKVEISYSDENGAQSVIVDEEWMITVRSEGEGATAYISKTDGTSGSYIKGTNALLNSSGKGNSNVISKEDREALQKELEEWLKTANIQFTADSIVLGESTIDDAKAAYCYESDYKSNLMQEGTADTVYSLPYRGTTPEGYTVDSFGYLFTAPAEGGPIDHITVADKKITCLGGINTGDSADAFWDFIGIRPSAEMGDEALTTTGSDGSFVAISLSTFYYEKDNKSVSVEINTDLGIVTYIILALM